jgi:hypothetical protein
LQFAQAQAEEQRSSLGVRPGIKRAPDLDAGGFSLGFGAFGIQKAKKNVAADAGRRVC